MKTMTRLLPRPHRAFHHKVSICAKSLCLIFATICLSAATGWAQSTESKLNYRPQERTVLMPALQHIPTISEQKNAGLLPQIPEKQALQEPTDERCGFVYVEQLLQQRYPDRPTQMQFEQWMQQSIARGNYDASRAVVTIPVVVHVIHNGQAVGGLPNISVEQVQSQIDVLNEDFQRINLDAANTPAPFLPVASNPEIVFCLATVDPDGNPTNGITRYNGGQATYSIGDLENNIKPATIWHPDFYFNIWSAPLQGGLLGYAQFPDLSGLPGMPPAIGAAGPARTDGIVVRDLAFGRLGSSTAPFNLGRTATHEVGHFFGLRHIGGDGSCAVDDFCADTPTQNGQNTTVVADCSWPQDNDCDDGAGDLPDMFQNYMDYSDDGCMNLFTNDQKSRFDVVLANSPRRASLLTSQVCSGVAPSYPFDPFAGAPANDLCANAEPIQCGDTKTGSTTTAFSIGAPGFCGTTVDAAGVWYSFTGDGTTVTLSLCASTYDTQINVYSGSCGNFTCVAGNDDFCGLRSQVTFPTINGTEYIIYVNGYGGSTGDFSLAMTCAAGPPPPPTGPVNDLCANALPIACGESLSGTTTGATTIGDPIGGVCGTSVTTAGVWYTLTGTGGPVTASTCNAAKYDTKLHVFTGNCGSFVCVGGNDDTPGCSGSTSEVEFLSIAGETYYVFVSGFNGATGGFTLSITCPEPLANDLCENAQPLACGDVVSGSTNLATATGAPATDCSDDDPFNDNLGAGVWYVLTGTGRDIELSTCGAASFDTKIDVFTGTCGSLVCYAGNDDATGCAGFTSKVTFASVEGETYYVYVSGFGASRGTFTLSVDCACVADAGECATVYYGYAPAACTDLTASVMDGVAPYTYAWSNGGTTETITVCPTTTTTYSVTITDAEGCTSTDEVTVEVIDVRCGNKNDMVQVCHIPPSIPGIPGIAVPTCISPNAVAAHLAHGDNLGPCGTVPCEASGTGTRTFAGNVSGFAQEWNLYPNPATGWVIIDLTDLHDTPLQLTIYESSGKVVRSYPLANAELPVIEMDVADMAAGVYMVRLQTDQQTMYRKLMITKP